MFLSLGFCLICVSVVFSYIFVFVFNVFGLVFSILAKRLAGKGVSEMAHCVSNGAYNPLLSQLVSSADSLGTTFVTTGQETVDEE